MRAVVQRVTRAAVTVDGATVGEIEQGLMVLVGVGHDDGPADAEALAGKLAGLRVFADPEGRMNLAVDDVGGAVLVVSQFTLLGDVRRGKRPSFTDAAPPDHAEPLVDEVVGCLQRAGIEVATGTFGARMEVSLVNDGPVTLVVETRNGKVV
ncbi:MAG: D-tyrosyl-tRNA(Tyr) deacylase [Acidimicrobiia bacterium]|nr:D-tyrosyl-tRNA(Tyr) deacylase [Acidimicrobiia bacterium]NNF68236.1 D-tyrosyl-tRNA(Tyr) deacylase [Acidimicrobiia bacterium]